MAKKKQSPKSSRGNWAQDFFSFIRDLRDESERATVIIAAAKLDQLLYHLLVATLRPCPSNNDELLGRNRPLSSFGARINLAHRMGLITDEFAESLHLVQRIRNHFAHEVAGASLGSGNNRNDVRKLVAPYLNTEDYQLGMQHFFQDEHNPSNQFRMIVTMFAFRLEKAIDSAKRLSDADAVAPASSD